MRAVLRGCIAVLLALATPLSHASSDLIFAAGFESYYGFAVSTPVIAAPPGTSATYCYYFRSPNAATLGIKRWASTMTAAVHHLILFATYDDGWSPAERQPPGTLTLIEAPWRFESHFNALSLYQDVHRQRVKIGLITPVCGTYDFGEYPEEQPGMPMRWFVHLTSLLRGETHGADYLVIHKTSRDVAADPPPPWPDLRGCMPLIEAKFGPPVYRDDRIAVFALTRVSPLGNTGRSVQQ